VPAFAQGVFTKLLRLKRYALGLVGFLLHSAFFAFVVVAVAASHDPEADVGYVVFLYVDYPASTFAGGLPGIFLFGGLLWFLYGFTLQAVLSCRKRSDLLWLAPPAGVLALMFAIPWVMFLSLPKWQQEWTLGTSADNSGDSGGAVRHVAEAIRLASPEDNLNYGLSEYLGEVFVGRHEYDQAEKAFLSYLSLAVKQNASRNDWDVARGDSGPANVLAAYNELAQVYQLAGDPQKEKQARLEAAKWNRIRSKGDSVQEADCWGRIAEISYEAGDQKSGIELMQKAITMEGATHPPGETSSINDMRDELSKWKAAQP
jgi:hypothetical protein